MPDLTLVKGSANFNIFITLTDSSTGGPFDLSTLGITTATLTIKTTDYVTTVLTKSLVIDSLTTSPQVHWALIAGDWTSITAGVAYYGQIVFTDGANLVFPTPQFDVRVVPKL